MRGQVIKVAKFELTLADFRSMQAYLCRPIKYPWYVQVLIGVASAVIVLTLFGAGVSSGSFMLGFLGGLGLFMASILWGSARARRVLAPAPRGAILCDYEYTLDEHGISTRTPGWDTLTRWSAVLGVEETPELLFVRIDRVAVYTIPKRAFSSPDHLAEFRDYVRSHLGTTARPLEDAAAPPVTRNVGGLSA